MVHKAIVVRYERCNGCRLCEIACSSRHEGISFPRASRIRILPFFPSLDIPVVCRQCETAPCLERCLQAGQATVGLTAIERDKDTNAVMIYEERCSGCGACIDACPAEAIFRHPKTKLAIKCDLCGGKPECVSICPEGALEYVLTPFDAEERLMPSPSCIAADLKRSLLRIRNR